MKTGKQWCFLEYGGCSSAFFTWTLQRNQRLQPGVALLHSLNQGLEQVHVQNVTFFTWGTAIPLLAHADAVVVRLYHNDKGVLGFFCGVLQVPLAAIRYCVSGGDQDQRH